VASSTLTTKGQITIPKAVREALQLEVGDSVYFDLRPDGVVVMTARNEPVNSLFGMLREKAKLRRPVTIDEMNPGSADN
jgi:AbrB family looped-hinge helix DNA binding protein